MEHNIDNNNLIEDEEGQIGAIEVEVDPNQPSRVRRNKNEDPMRKEKREKWKKKHTNKKRDGNTDGVIDKLEELDIHPEVVRIKNDGIVWRDPHYEYCEKKIEMTEDQIDEELGERTWQDVDWDAAREEAARAILANNKQAVLPHEIQETFKQETAGRWDRFYQHHKNNFFKNRYYLRSEFPEINEGSIKTSDGSKPIVLEVGCGVGNTLFPLVKNSPEKYFYAFDLSPKAIEVLKTHKRYDESRCKAFVCDITKDELPEEIREGKVDIVVSIFCLSAIPPEMMPSVMKKIYTCLKPGGMFILRDYGLYDMTQMRFFAKKGSQMGENFFVRGDGTFTYYFSLEEAERMMKTAGFDIMDNVYRTRVITNRKRKLKMYRVWLRGKYVKPIGESTLHTTITPVVVEETEKEIEKKKKKLEEKMNKIKNNNNNVDEQQEPNAEEK
jgi:SAM-dependent methyltransferase